MHCINKQKISKGIETVKMKPREILVPKSKINHKKDSLESFSGRSEQAGGGVRPTWHDPF